MKLALAVKASLPLIAVTTRDTVNFPEVLAHITGKKPKIWAPASQNKFDHNSLYFWICPKGFDKRLPLESLYDQCTNSESTLIIVNVNQMEPVFFDCGEVEVPKDMLVKSLAEIVEDEGAANALARSLGGVTLKEAVELSRLTMAGTAALEPDGVMATRKLFFAPSQGFTQVDTKQAYYKPSGELTEWIEDEGGYFLTGKDNRLRARGLLFTGHPGTGKTSGAKFIAHSLGVPLFRLDIASTKNKYVGSSEANLLAALTRIDGESPAVLLVDEIEKVFGATAGNDSGTTSGMLSQLLWWLQEHTSRILTVMTTNNLKAIPIELHRSGRIDKRITTEGLTSQDATAFVKQLLPTFDEWKSEANINDIAGIVKRAFNENTIPDTNPKEVPHSEVTEQVHKFVKHKITIGNGLSEMFNLKGKAS